MTARAPWHLPGYSDVGLSTARALTIFCLRPSRSLQPYGTSADHRVMVVFHQIKVRSILVNH